MAKATTHTISKPVVTTTFTTETVVRLELSTEEADTLYHILGYIAGNPANTRRKYTDAIKEALLGSWGGSHYRVVDNLSFSSTGDIRFHS